MAESRDLVGRKKIEAMDHQQLFVHLRSAKPVETCRDLPITILKETVDLQITLVQAAALKSQIPHLTEYPLTKPLECQLAQFPKYLPVGFFHPRNFSLALGPSHIMISFLEMFRTTTLSRTQRYFFEMH
jgi:hypothetical protein